MIEKYSLHNLPEGAGVLLILVLTLLLATLVKHASNRIITRARNDSDFNAMELIFARRCLTSVIYITGIGLALAKVPELQLVGHSMLAGAGVLTLVAGLASQQVLSNVLSGVLIVVFKPFRLGNRITITGMTGMVEDINLRQFVLRDLENNRIVIPNSLVSTTALINSHHTDSRTYKAIEIGIGYQSDIDTALAIMIEELRRHPLRIDGRTQEQLTNNEPDIAARVVSLGDSAVMLKAWVWAKNATDWYILSCDCLKSIKARFDAQGIVIPYPQITISYADGPVVHGRPS